MEGWQLKKDGLSAADPGFLVGGGGRQPLTRVLFGGNLCRNERIGSRGVGGAGGAL